MLHALRLIGLGASGLFGLRAPIVLLALGVMIFSGTLYVMALTDLRWLGMVTLLSCQARESSIQDKYSFDPPEMCITEITGN